MENLFIQASRTKLRFPSRAGEITVENLWDLPLTSRTGVSLDALAREANAGLKQQAEESFVETKVNPAKEIFTLRLEILKHVISVRQAENTAANEAVSRAQERAKLQELISKKQDAALEGESLEDLQKRLDALK